MRRSAWRNEKRSADPFNDEARVDERAKAARELPFIHPEDASEEARAEVTTFHGSEVEQLTCDAIETLKARTRRVGDTSGKLPLTRAPLHHPGELFKEERIAFREIMERARRLDVRRMLILEHTEQELDALGLGQRTERDGEHATRSVDGCAPCRQGRRSLVAKRHQQETRHVQGAEHDVGEQREADVVAPVQVLDA